MSANDRQVAGTHYQKRIQHWDWVVSRGISYLGGQATKYVSRWRNKNGIIDLQKADHFLEKMIEIHHEPPELMSTLDYVQSQDMGLKEVLITHMVMQYEMTNDPVYLTKARALVQELMQAAQPPAGGSG